MANPLDYVTQPMTEEDFVRSAVQGSLSDVDPNATVLRVQPVAPLARKVAQEENPLTAAIQKLRDYIESIDVVPDPTSPTGEFNSIAGTRKAAQEAYDRGTGNRLINKITGAGGEERFQFWPERMLRSGFSLPHDVMTGQEPIIDPATGRTSERVIERAQDTAGLAGGSTLFERPGVATLGSGAMRKGPTTPMTEGTPLPRVEAVRPVLESMDNVKFSPDMWVHKFQNLPEMQQALMLPEFQKTIKGGKASPKEVADYLEQVRMVDAPPAAGNMDRRSFLRGAASTAVNANRIMKFLGKVPETMAEFPTREVAPINFLDRSIKLHDSLPSQAMKDAFVNYGEELFHPGMMEKFYLKDLMEMGEITKGDYRDFVTWLKKNPVTKEDREFNRLRNMGHDVEAFDAGQFTDHKGSSSTKLLSDTSQPGMAIAGAANASKPAPVFYSALEHAAANAAQETMSPQQWLGWLKNQPGVKQEELQWTGLGDWLAEQKGKVSKSDVQRYLDEHKVEVKDVTKKSGDQLSRDSLEDAVDTYIDHAVDAFFDEHGRSPSQSELMTLRREIAEDIRANLHDYDLQEYEGVGDTRYGQYQLPGGKNYREHLLTLPTKGRKISQAERDRIDSDFENGYLNDKQYEDALAGYEKDNKGNYNSSHWDEPNVLAHVRTNDREMPVSYTAEEQQAIRQIEEAKPVLAGLAHQQREIFTEIRRITDPLEKIRRSKIGDDMNSGKLSRSEALKKLEEYVDYPEVKSLQDRLDKLRAEEDRVRAALPKMPEQRNVPTLHLEEIQSDWHQAGRKEGYQSNERPATKEEIERGEARTNNQGVPVVGGSRNAVPDAPFKTSWTELALKRMIRMAAEEGKDRISWTPGEAQAARYDLSKQVESINAWKNADGTFRVEAYPKGRIGGATKLGDEIPKEKLSDFVGKDLADKIANIKTTGGSANVFKGGDLKIGGEGMKGFYDDILPKTIEKLGKKYGVKVKQESAAVDRLYSPDYIDAKARQRAGLDYDKELVRSVESEKAPVHNSPVWYFDIPPAWKDQALSKGFPLFTSGIPFPLKPVDYNPFTNKDAM